MSENRHDDDKTQTHIPLTKDTTVGHYRIIEKIGSGGMGEVYLAQDTRLDRKVALKFLASHLCQDDDCRKRFTSRGAPPLSAAMRTAYRPLLVQSSGS